MNTKKRIAFWLAVIMLIGMMPTVTLADLPNPTAGDRPWFQRPVMDSTIIVGEDSGEGRYYLNIQWSRPPLTSRVAAAVGLSSLQGNSPFDESLWSLFPIRYYIEMRNATLNKNFGDDVTLPPYAIPATHPQRQSRSRPPGLRFEERTGNLFARDLAPASLYEINIRPFRNIPQYVPLNPGDIVPPVRPLQPVLGGAPIDTSVPHPRSLLFLTDITPSGTGRGNSITLTWDNPTMGTLYFPYWNIAFAPYPLPPGQGIPGAGRSYPVRGINAGDEEIRRNADGTLSITIESPAISPTGRYAVRVEPMLTPTRRVRADDYATLTHRGTNYAIFATRNEYRTVVTMIPDLFVEEAGAEHIRLWWPDITGFAEGLHRIEVEEWPYTMRGTVPPEGATPMQTLRIFVYDYFFRITEVFVGAETPAEPRGFVLAFHIMGGDGEIEILRTHVVVFNPRVAQFSPYRPEIVRLDHAGSGALSMEWLAFARFPAVADEIASIPPDNPYNNRFVDTDVFYEIFVTDSWGNFNRLTTPLLTIAPRQLGRSRVLSPGNHLEPMFDPTWQFWPQDFIRLYQSVNEQGIIEQNYIRGNRVYFVRIRAVRDTPYRETSTWAYGSVYVPPLEVLEIIPEMLSSPPVEIINRADMHITRTSIPIGWDFRYLEIMQPFTTTSAINFDPRNPVPERDLWHSVVGVSQDNRLIFGRSAAHINYVKGSPMLGEDPRHDLLNRIITPELRNRLLGLERFPINVGQPTQVAEFLRQARPQVEGFLFDLGFTQDEPPVTLRIQDTYRFRYEIHVVPYMTVRQFLGGAGQPDGFEGYMRYIRGNEVYWESIGRPTITNGRVYHKAENLSENTPYVIFIRPYVLVGGSRIPAWYPTFVIGTTVLTPDRTTPAPTTPVLFEVPRYTTRNRVAARWRVQSDMLYTINVSHFFPDYHAGGTSIPLTWAQISAALDGEVVEIEEPGALLDVQIHNGEQYFHLRILERFPDTNYYIWAFAFGVNEAGVVESGPSNPSNPVEIRTLDIEPPPPPRSFGRAPQNLLNMFNRYNETEYRADEPEALNILWRRIFADLRDGMGNLTERAEAGAGDGNVRPLNLPNISDTEAYAAIHVLRFEGLVANRRYYARARTILTVQRGGPDIYSYEVQLADNDDFLDAVTFIIPPLIAESPINTRRATSEWAYAEMDTGTTDDEFDGVHLPDQYPLPERDWEITYDPLTQTLTWRFRTNHRDADGRLDQNVDQRFITRLIQERVFTFTADLSTHQGMPVSNREVILPKSISRAFDERRITFKILAGDKSIAILPGAFNTAQTRALQVGIGSYYRIALNMAESGFPPVATNTDFATFPTRLTVSVITPQRTVNLDTFARPIEIVLQVEQHIGPDGLRTGLFTVNPATASWKDTQGRFSFAENTISSAIQAPTTFAGIARNAPLIETQHPSNAAMKRVTTRMTITDMTTFTPNREVTANKFNNIVNALAANRTTVTLGATLPATATRSLTNARLLAPQNLTREAAIDIMVRLYENRTRQVLMPMSAGASIPGLQNATPALHRNLRIAADIGFILGPLEPYGRLTMGELMGMVDIIIQDSGM